MKRAESGTAEWLKMCLEITKEWRTAEWIKICLEITKENCDKLEYAGGVQCPRLRLHIGACAQ